MKKSRRTSRLLSVVAALTLVVGVGVGVNAISETQSAWNDRSYSSAVVTAGEWAAPATIGCVVVTADGTPKPGGTCTVTKVTFDQWGDDATTHFRNYYVTMTSNSAGAYLRATLDLSTATMGTNSGTGTWKWGNAATTGGQIKPSTTCAALPNMTGITSQAWNAQETFFFTVVDNKNTVAATSRTCG